MTTSDLTGRPTDPTAAPAAVGQQEFVVRLIAEITGVPEESVLPDADLVEDLYIDSVAKIELMVACEKHFDVRIPDETVESFRTVRSVLDHLAALGASS